jgi:ATPase subunit of ABC transporter with duplicated ATPase domains
VWNKETSAPYRQAKANLARRIESITFLSNYLQGYPSTVLVVSHDRAFLNEVATDIIWDVSRVWNKETSAPYRQAKANLARRIELVRETNAYPTEPSNMLDVPSITFLSNYLQGYPSTVLVVSHDIRSRGVSCNLPKLAPL